MLSTFLSVARSRLSGAVCARRLDLLGVSMDGASLQPHPRLSAAVVSIRVSKIDFCGGCVLPRLVMAGAEADKGIGPVMRVRGMEQGPMEFAEFYESTRDDCLRIVLLHVGDRHLAHDLVAPHVHQGVDVVAEGTGVGGAAGMGRAHRAEYARVLVAPPSA